MFCKIIGRPYEHLITWNDIKERFPWDVILLGGIHQCLNQ